MTKRNPKYKAYVFSNVGHVPHLLAIATVDEPAFARQWIISRLLDEGRDARNSGHDDSEIMGIVVDQRRPKSNQHRLYGFADHFGGIFALPITMPNNFTRFQELWAAGEAQENAIVVAQHD
jgi:hypothetical protein